MKTSVAITWCWRRCFEEYTTDMFVNNTLILTTWVIALTVKLFNVTSLLTT